MANKFYAASTKPVRQFEPAVLTSPTAVSITATGATPRVTTTLGNGSLYCVIVPNDNTPTNAQIIAGKQASGAAAPAAGTLAVTSSGVKTFPAKTGLAAGTQYDVIFLHVGADGSYSAQAKYDLLTSASALRQEVAE